MSSSGQKTLNIFSKSFKSQKIIVGFSFLLDFFLFCCCIIKFVDIYFGVYNYVDRGSITELQKSTFFVTTLIQQALQGLVFCSALLILYKIRRILNLRPIC